MSKELVAAVQALKRPQLIELLKKVKPFLSLATAGKSREALIDAALELHGKTKPNKFYGKELFGFTDAAHIKIPKRETKEETAQKKRAKTIKDTESKIKETEKKRKAAAEKVSAAEKKQKESESKREEGRKRYMSKKDKIEELKKRIKGASKAELAKIRKEMEELKKA
jgi:cell wall-associated NlpC family hydrolase